MGRWKWWKRVRCGWKSLSNCVVTVMDGLFEGRVGLEGLGERSR
jgi:hypothetical protein